MAPVFVRGLPGLHTEHAKCNAQEIATLVREMVENMKAETGETFERARRPDIGGS